MKSPSTSSLTQLDSNEAIAVFWLNASFGKPAYEDVVLVYRTLEVLVASYAQYASDLHAQDSENEFAASAGVRPETPSRDFVQQAKHIQKLHRKLNEALAILSITPQIVGQLTDASWQIFMVSQPNKRDFRVTYGDSRDGVAITKATVVVALLELAKLSNLKSVRLCEWCKRRWLISRREMDKYCCSTCRIEANQNSPDGKRRHRIAQKKYRNSAGFKLAAK